MNDQQFIELLSAELGQPANGEQAACIRHNPDIPLMIAAGPGTGKTTVLVQRALRFVFVDRMLPEQILITTFTKKAAVEIRTRLITWGEKLLLGAARTADDEFRAFLANIDINRFVTGTLDSVCEDALASAREPDERPPVVAEAFAANLLLSRQGKLFEENRALGTALGIYLHPFISSQYPPRSIGDLTKAIRLFVDRFRYDDVDLKAFLAPGPHLPARKGVVNIYKRYVDFLASSNRMDFAALELSIRDRLRADRIPENLKPLKAVLVDEYQDTNLLQEQLYFALVEKTGASLTVVGDDDQSLYRFRGATMELFKAFVSRAHDRLATKPELLFLTENYRSTPDIIGFFNKHIRYDDDFQAARVQPPKPPITDSKAANRIPILGLFRDTPEELAEDVAKLLHQIFRVGGRPADETLPEAIEPDPNEGNVGDAVLIAHTVNEYSTYNGIQKSRFPHHLRSELETRGIRCFNPRGQAIKHIEDVQGLLGLVLEVLDPSTETDPNGTLVPALSVSGEAKRVFLQWRRVAGQIIKNRDKYLSPRGDTLADVIARWKDLTQHGGGSGNDWPVLDVIYSFLPWFDHFQDDPEHQVYLEAITRCAGEAGTVSAYRSSLFKNEPHRTLSIQSALRDILAPIADELIDADEEILANVPRDTLNVMTIHQAKGLEYPLVIVDVSSAFNMNHARNAFRRFPNEPSSTAILEDHLSESTSIGADRQMRTALQRSFDDLVRLYYVAYSRPQNILLLVGCSKSLRYLKPVKHVGQGWRSNGTWAWRKNPLIKKNAPVFGDDLPFKSL